MSLSVRQWGLFVSPVSLRVPAAGEVPSEYSKADLSSKHSQWLRDKTGGESTQPGENTLCLGAIVSLS